MIDKHLFKDECSYEVKNNKYIFIKSEFTDNNEEDNLSKLKEKLKKFTKLYQWLIRIISPVNSNFLQQDFLDTYVNKDKVCLNIGSGNSKIDEHVCNIDMFAYDNVNIVCNIMELPFKDNSIDVILNIAVLEHVTNPQKVMDEIYRVLKPGGVVYTAFPFIQGYHASPYDFTRVTKEGMKVLHNKFEKLDLKPFGGPTSGMLWIVQEWLAILFSFGSKKLHTVIYLFLVMTTFPLKFLDYLLIHHPHAENITSGFIFIGEKKINGD